MKNLAEQVRDRVWHSLCSDTADVAGITLAELQQVPMGGRQLSGAGRGAGPLLWYLAR
jgi:hypothetical protein